MCYICITVHLKDLMSTSKKILFPFSWILYFIFILIFVSAILIKDGVCIIPEVSQEGELQSFKNYEDVAMFYYNVPKQVLRATWQFSAFVDDSKCPQRKVHILLKWGSYPVISVNNATYPPHMYVDNNHTIYVSIVTNFESNSMTIVPIYSPEPGDWFVGAYLSDLDDKVRQKGLSHKCRYSLGSVAIWSVTSGIQNIPLGYQNTIKTSETISYYKIFIPMDTWNFQVDIWGCNFMLRSIQNYNGLCIQNLALKARVLPFHNHSDSSSIKNLTTIDTYTFTEYSPFQDTWYYLMIVSGSSITFNIKITVSNCPVKTMQKLFISPQISGSLYSKILTHSYLKNFKEQFLKSYSIEQRQLQQNSILKNNVEDDYNFSLCFPRYQLVRIKHTQIFSGDYLLQGKEGPTPWLSLTDNYPVIIQFDILPLRDIGGTLAINVHLELDKIINKQQVNVNICISRGKIPKYITGNITCDNRYMMIQLSSTDTLNASLLLPYPQPDIWYISFQTTCYVNKMLVHCEMEEVLVSLSIKLRACVFEESNPCSHYGICQEIHKGLLYYTACKCFEGRQGWGCTDTANAFSELLIILTTLFLTLSNLFFIPAIYLAFKHKLYTEGLIYLFTMLFSAFYHACDQQFSTYCIAKYEVLQYCDFFLGILAFWVTLVAMADISVQYVSFFHMFGAIIISFGVESDKTGLNSILLPLIIGSFIPLSSYFYNCFKLKKIIIPKKMIKLSIGLLLAGIGILLYSLVETNSNYKYIHSFWHIIIALSLIFLLPLEKG